MQNPTRNENAYNHVTVYTWLDLLVTSCWLGWSYEKIAANNSIYCLCKINNTIIFPVYVDKYDKSVNSIDTVIGQVFSVTVVSANEETSYIVGSVSVSVSLTMYYLVQIFHLLVNQTEWIWNKA